MTADAQERVLPEKFERAVLRKNLKVVRGALRHPKLNESIVNIPNAHGLTALHHAAYYGWIEGVRLFLREGFDIDVVDRDGSTPLHLAAYAGHLEVMTELIQRGAQVDIEDVDGSTAFQKAVVKGNSECLVVLATAGAKYDHLDKDGLSALHKAARVGNVEQIVLMIEMGLDVQVLAKDGTTALHQATIGGHPDIMELLIGAGCSIVAKDQRRCSALHYAAASTNSQCMHAILRHSGWEKLSKKEKKAAVRALDHQGYTPLWIAVERANGPICMMLMNTEVDINVKDSQMDTLLHVAVRTGSYSICELLITSGIKRGVRNKANKKAEELITEAHENLRELFKTPVDVVSVTRSPSQGYKRRNNKGKKGTKRMKMEEAVPEAMLLPPPLPPRNRVKAPRSVSPSPQPTGPYPSSEVLTQYEEENPWVLEEKVGEDKLGPFILEGEEDRKLFISIEQCHDMGYTEMVVGDAMIASEDILLALGIEEEEVKLELTAGQVAQMGISNVDELEDMDELINLAEAHGIEIPVPRPVVLIVVPMEELQALHSGVNVLVDDDEAVLAQLEAQISGMQEAGRLVETLKQDLVEEEVPLVYDRFGFLMTESLALYDLTSKERRTEISRTRKWVAMLDNWESGKVKRKLKGRIFKGIPEAIRSVVWKKFLHIEELLDANSGQYEAFCASESVWASHISKDLSRTFAEHELFGVEEGWEVLGRVLQAISVRCPMVGYCQGMGFVVATLLMFMDEEEAFWATVVLLESPSFHIQDFYYTGLPGCQRGCFVLEELIKVHLPKLYRHFARIDLEGIFYATPWLMTCFSYSLPFALLLPLWDILIYHGSDAMYPIALGILKYLEPALLANSREGCNVLLKLEATELHGRVGKVDIVRLLKGIRGYMSCTRLLSGIERRWARIFPELAEAIRVPTLPELDEPVVSGEEGELASTPGEEIVLEDIMSSASYESSLYESGGEGDVYHSMVQL